MASGASDMLVGSSKSSTIDDFQVTVRLLEDDSSIVVYIPESAKGRWLLEEVCRRQGVLPEIEYFGLRYISCELLSTPTKHWMNLTKSVRSQLKHTKPLLVSFRIKHYPPDPITEFQLDKSKYLLFHQIHRDFLSGRLIAPHEDIILLAALFIQVALGDASEMAASASEYNLPGSPSTNTLKTSTYLSNYRALHSTDRKYEAEIIEQHRKLEGLLPSEAASEAIRIALRQLSYGMEPFKVQPTKHKNSRPVHIGLTHEGVAEFTGSKRSHLYKWTDIDQFFCSGRNFIISCKKPAHEGERKTSKRSHETVQYRCESGAIASELWKWALERKLFFTLEKSTLMKPISTKYNLFSRRHTLNFAGRCRSELMNSKSQSATLPNCLRPPTQNVHQTSISASTPGLQQPRHHHHHHPLHNHPRKGSRSSTLSSVVPKSMSEGSITNNTSNYHTVSVSSSAAPSSLSNAERSTEGTPIFVRLAPYFEAIPNRKYTSLSRLRQRKCVNLATDPSLRSLRSMDDLRLNGILGQPILEAREPLTELVNFPPLRMSSASKSIFEMKSETKPNVTTNTNAISNDKTDNTDARASIPCRTPRLWRYILVTGGLSLIIILGTTLATETSFRGPLVMRVRASHLFTNWEAYCYHPLRSLLPGLFQ